MTPGDKSYPHGVPFCGTDPLVALYIGFYRCLNDFRRRDLRGTLKSLGPTGGTTWGGTFEVAQIHSTSINVIKLKATLGKDHKAWVDNYVKSIAARYGVDSPIFAIY